MEIVSNVYLIVRYIMRIPYYFLEPSGDKKKIRLCNHEAEFGEIGTVLGNDKPY
jgi:hypothetical protein